MGFFFFFFYAIKVSIWMAYDAGLFLYTIVMFEEGIRISPIFFLGGGGYENNEFMFSGQKTDNETILFHVIFNR